MEELWRICRDGARITVRGPYYKSHYAFGDPTHRHFFTENSFVFFADSHMHSFYSHARFKVERTRLVTHGLRLLLPFKRFLNFFLWNIFDEIEFTLLVKKESVKKP